MCVHVFKHQGHSLFVCICVYWAGGMNPNEIFYGPVDLLIVPQVLSLLTPNLLETTCWVWFFLFVSSLPPLLLFITVFFLFSSRWPQSCRLQVPLTFFVLCHFLLPGDVRVIFWVFVHTSTWQKRRLHFSILKVTVHLNMYQVPWSNKVFSTHKHIIKILHCNIMWSCEVLMVFF